MSTNTLNRCTSRIQSLFLLLEVYVRRPSKRRPLFGYKRICNTSVVPSHPRQVKVGIRRCSPTKNFSLGLGVMGSFIIKHYCFYHIYKKRIDLDLRTGGTKFVLSLTFEVRQTYLFLNIFTKQVRVFPFSQIYMSRTFYVRVEVLSNHVSSPFY